MLTTQTAEHHATAGASETAGSHVFRPPERPPTQLHQAPSRLQRCAPSRLSTISGAAEPKSLSPPASSSLDRPNIHYLNLPIILGRLGRASAQEEARQGLPPKSRLIFRSLRVHTCSRQPVLVRSYLNAVIPALHLFCISQNFLRRYSASQQ